jgi:hypothetical protein
MPAALQNQYSLKHGIYSHIGVEEDPNRIALMDAILGAQRDNERLIPLAEKFADAHIALAKLKSSRASLLSAFDNKKTEIARETRAELRDLASSRFAKRNEDIRKDILTLIKQSDIFLPDTKLAKNFNIEDEPSLRLAFNFKHYWRQLKAWLRLERELTARRDKALLDLERLREAVS